MPLSPLPNVLFHPYNPSPRRYRARSCVGAHRGGHDDHNHNNHQHHEHYHAQRGDDVCASAQPKVDTGGVVVIRPTSGLSGDMTLAGLACLAGADSGQLGAIAALIGLPQDCVALERRAVNDIFGWGCRVTLPETTARRTWADIRALIAESGLSTKGKQLAETTFALLAEAEGRVHGIAPGQVHFHEIGALDSILDICLCAEIFARLAPSRLVCGPLPLCDGTVKCEHGLLPAPAPAVLELLQGVPVRGIASEGETVTPTAIALLKGLGAEFAAWPDITVERTALVYGGRVLPGIPNGALFALGRTAAVQPPGAR
jgi:pyridinium-3,5-bisthiocarboxylic acid mononucleotide nickel chelatase